MADQEKAIAFEPSSFCQALDESQRATEVLPQLQFLSSSRARGIRGRIMRFTASWFSVTMGTGMVNTLLCILPWPAARSVFRGIGVAFLALDFIIFSLFAAMYTARSILYPEIFPVMLRHSSQSLFLGTIPMGYTTLIGGLTRFAHDYAAPGDASPVFIVSFFWWIGLVGSCAIAFGIPWAMFTRHDHCTKNLTAAWLLPIVPPITVAATGTNLASYFAETYPMYSLAILLSCYVMLGIGLLLSFSFLVIYIQRLAVHHLPDRDAIVSTFLPLGPCGQGGFSLMGLGRVSRTLFPHLASLYPENQAYQALSELSLAIHGGGIVAGLLLWGFALWWLFLAVMSVKSISVTSLAAFNMGFWAFTFPLGSLAMLTLEIAETFDAMVLRVIGSLFSVVVFALWLVVAIPTVQGFLAGTLFHAPCLDSLPPGYGQKLPHLETQSPTVTDGCLTPPRL